MMDAVLLVILNLLFIYSLISLMEKRLHKSYRDKYGAQIEEFEAVIYCFQNFDFDNIPKPQINQNTVYNNLLIVTSSYLKAYQALDMSKNQLIEFSVRNKELIKSYIDVLESLKLSTAKFQGLDRDAEVAMTDVINKVEASIKKLTQEY